MQMDATAILQTVINYAISSKNKDIVQVVIGAMAEQAGCADSMDVARLVDEVLVPPPARVSINALWAEVQTPSVRVPVSDDATPALKQLLAEINQKSSKSS